MARPIATRWRCPPESWRGKRSSSGFSPRMSAARFTRLSISVFGAPRSLSEKPMLAATVMCG